MAPRTEFVLASMAIAAALLVAVVVLMDIDRRLPGAREWLAALRFTPAALLAAGLGAWFASRWQARAQRLGRRWAPGGMTLRTLLVVFLLFPLALAAWIVVGTGIDWLAAAQPADWSESLAWLPVIVFYGSLAAVMFGAAPAFFLEYFACRRYLRRQAGSTMGHA